ncbi:MAG: SPFH domain-containing protein [Desulfatirhabdiaceae bacterium]
MNEPKDLIKLSPKKKLSRLFTIQKIPRFWSNWSKPKFLIILPVLCLFLLGSWVWFFCRIEPENDRIAILIRKTGDPLPASQILADKPGQKGIQLAVLPEGRYFRNPYIWSWRLSRVTDIPAGKLGVLVRLYGEDLPTGTIIAEDGQKGIVAEVLRPGKYRINPYAYAVQVVDAVSIRPGHVGVVVSLVGQDIFQQVEKTTVTDEFLVMEQQKGTQSRVLDPGTYYLNPFIVNVVEVNLQSQRFEMSGNDAISFLTQDGFDVRVEGTIEFNIMRQDAARLTHRVGDIGDIVQKIILPRARGYSRIEGSKKRAVDFIVGESRQQFENNLEKHLLQTCQPWGMSVNSVLIRNIIPPDEIAAVIRDREIAVQEARKYHQQIQQSKSKAELVRQEMLAKQNSAKVAAETQKLKAVIEARQRMAVDLVGAKQELEVARIDQQAAAAKAGAIVVAAQAEKDVIQMQNQAEAEVLADRAKAFGGGDNLARYVFQTRLAPQIDTILTSDQPQGLGPSILPTPAKSTGEVKK